MTKTEIEEILTKHKKWLNGKKGGERAILSDSDLRCSDLRHSDLRDSDLRDSDLRHSDLRHSDLSEANLPSPTVLLQCYWGEVNDKLTTELMRYDASNHPDPAKFQEWADGGDCPYDRGFARAANFLEKRELWKPGKAKSARELVLMLFKEKNIKHSEDL